MDIKNKKYLSEKELYDIDIDEMEFSVRTYNTLARAKCRTLGDIVDLTIEELEGVVKIGNTSGAVKLNDKALNEIQDKLKEYGFSLLTKEQKQHILSSTDKPEVFREEINRLERHNVKLEECCQHFKELLYKKQNNTKNRQDRQEQDIRRQREINLRTAQKVAKETSYPVGTIIGEMRFGMPSEAACGFCNIFQLYDYGCAVENCEGGFGSQKRHCAECIENFLIAKCWRLPDVDTLQGDSQPPEKVFQVHLGFNDICGRCPRCMKKLEYIEGQMYCSRCGQKLDWDMENWNEECKERKRLWECYNNDEEWGENVEEWDENVEE